MKRTKALSLKKETVHVLTSTELAMVPGGGAIETGRACNQVGNATGSCQSTEPYVMSGVVYYYVAR